MVDGLATELLCTVCDEVCKRGAQMKCCGARACRACAVLKINKNKKCWNDECGQEDITAVNDLQNDDLLRKAVEYFNKNGKMNPAHEKALKKTKDGKKEGKKDGEKKEKKAPVDVGEKFNQPCTFGEKCRRGPLCLFVHDTETLGDKIKKAKLREEGNGKPCKKGAECTNEKCKFGHPHVPIPKAKKEKKEKKGEKKVVKGKKGEKAAKVEAKPAAKGNGKPCKFGSLCTKKDVCKFDHPKINKPCRFGAGCTTKGCKFDHSPSSKALNRAMGALKTGRPMGGDLRNKLASRGPMGGGMGRMGGMESMGGMRGMGGGMGGGMMRSRMNEMAMDEDWDNMGGRNTNLAQMQKMKEELESMMKNVMGRSSGGGGMGGGYGGSMDRMERSMMSSRDMPMSRGYGAPSRYNF